MEMEGELVPRPSFSRAQGLPAELQLLRLLPFKHHPGILSDPTLLPSLCGAAVVYQQPLLLILVHLTQAADGG